jgi:PHP family Zn ribbon phosphoesterase
VSKNKVPFKSLIPLEEIVASSIGKTVLAKDVGIYYDKLINNLGTEFNILLDANKKEIEKFSLPEIAQGILQVREGKVKIEPGYDGVYGKIKIL